MRSFRFLIPMVILITTFTLNSCENEPVDTSLLTDDRVGTGEGTTASYYIKVTKDGVVKQWSTVQALNVLGVNSFVFTAAEPSS